MNRSFFQRIRILMIFFGKKAVLLLAAGAAFVCAPVFNAYAQDDSAMPPQAVAAAASAPEYELPDGLETHPMMRLTPDKSEIVHLDRDAASLIVGNPIHLNVMMDNTRTLVLVPREPGASQFTVMDAQGRVIMQRHVIVASPKQDYIRIRRTCANSQAAGCVETSMYYCPDMCHETKIMGTNTAIPTLSGDGSIAPTGGGLGGDSGGGDYGEDAAPSMSPQEMLLNTLQQLLTNGQPSMEDIPE